MKPSILIYGFSLFLICLALHVLVWRWRRPKNHAVALFQVFLIPAGLCLFVTALTSPEVSLLNLVAIGLLHVSLSFAYIQAYPASQADSPSLRILLLVGGSPNGLTEAEIQTRFSQERLFHERIQDLMDAHLAEIAGDQIRITAKGRWFVLPFIELRRLLGLPSGGG